MKIIEWLKNNQDFELIDKKRQLQPVDGYPHIMDCQDSYVELSSDHKPNLRIPFVYWDDKYITVRKLNPNESNAISLRFSGCCMAKFEDKLGNKYVSHINVTLGNNMLNEFLGYCYEQQFRNIIVFKPYYEDLINFSQEVANIVNSSPLNTVGIFDENFDCYSAYFMITQCNLNPQHLYRIVKHNTCLRLPNGIDFKVYESDIRGYHFSVVYLR